MGPVQSQSEVLPPGHLDPHFLHRVMAVGYSALVAMAFCDVTIMAACNKGGGEEDEKQQQLSLGS